MAKARIYEQSFDNLFLYIDRNKIIKALLDKITPENLQVEQLLVAINTGDAHANIWNDPECHIYLLYLIKQKKIPFAQGMTVYTYLMALMQFTDKQPLKATDNDVKSMREITVEPLAIHQQITRIG